MRDRMLLLVLVGLAASCTTKKTLVPHQLPRSEYYPPPVLQTTLAAAVHEASQKSLGGMTEVRDKRTCVSINGVVPMSNEALLGHVRGVVEAGLAKQGAIVTPCCNLVSTDVDGLGRAVWKCDNNVDYRAIVSLDAGGVDVSIERRPALEKLAGPALLFGASMVSFFMIRPIRDEYEVIPFYLGLGLLGSSATWSALFPPFDHPTVLDGKVSMQVALLPQRTGLPHVAGSGSGTSQLVLEDADDAEFVLAR